MQNEHIIRLVKIRDGLVDRRREAVMTFGAQDPRTDLDTLEKLQSRIDAVEAMIAHEERLASEEPKPRQDRGGPEPARLHNL